MTTMFLLGGASVSAAIDYSSVVVPTSLDFGEITVSGPTLVVSGSATLDGDQGADCLVGEVNPTSLAISDLFEPLCSDTPRLTGQTVAVVQAEAKTMVVSVRIARLSSAGRLVVGPTVVTYTELSDTHLETVRAAGSLWLYAPDTPTGARALRISETTGQVLQNTPVSPGMDRPVIAANANGLYLAPTSETGFLGSGAQANENGIIYHVGIGASGVQIFDASSSKTQFPGYVSWITGESNSLWADICQRPVGTGCTITRFNGSSSEPVFQTSDHNMTGSWVIGSVAQGFYSLVLPPTTGNQGTVTDKVVRIDPDTGATQTVASVPLPQFWQGNYFSGSSEAALLGDSLYLLVPPESTAANPSPGALYRVPLPEHS